MNPFGTEEMAWTIQITTAVVFTGFMAWICLWCMVGVMREKWLGGTKYAFAAIFFLLAVLSFLLGASIVNDIERDRKAAVAKGAAK